MNRGKIRDQRGQPIRDKQGLITFLSGLTPQTVSQYIPYSSNLDNFAKNMGKFFTKIY